MTSSHVVNRCLATHVSKVVLVTGASAGSGLATTTRFARESAAFLVTYPA